MTEFKAKNIFRASAVFLIFSSAFVWLQPIQIVALEVSATKCRGVPRAQAFPAILGSLPKVNSKRQIVILETGPDNANIGVAVGYTEKLLARLQ